MLLSQMRDQLCPKAWSGPGNNSRSCLLCWNNLSELEYENKFLLSSWLLLEKRNIFICKNYKLSWILVSSFPFGYLGIWAGGDFHRFPVCFWCTCGFGPWMARRGRGRFLFVEERNLKSHVARAVSYRKSQSLLRLAVHWNRWREMVVWETERLGALVYRSKDHLDEVKNPLSSWYSFRYS